MDAAAWIELVGALAALAGAAVSVVALYLSYRANKAAEAARERSEEINKQAQRREDERNRREQEHEEREEEREKRLMAGCLQAWWCKATIEGRESWGVLVSNDGPYSAVFRNLIVKLSDENNPQTTELRLRMIPPGFYYCASNSKALTGWDFPKRLVSLDGLQPATQSNKHRIHSMTFDDQLHSRWEWTEAGQLNRIRRDG